MRQEYAAAYVGEKTVRGFLKRVGTTWPKPIMYVGSGKEKYLVWRKSDFDRIIDPELLRVDPEPL